MEYDVIIIGSGAGGLTSGAFLAKQGYKVLILENHTIPGGYLHGFKRKNFYFDSAVYSIAGCGDNGYVKYLLDKLEIYNKLNFIEYNSIYKIMLPSGEYILPCGIENFKNYLISLFPEESNNIINLINEMVYLYQIMETEKFGKKVSETDYSKCLFKWGKKSYKEFIDFFIKNEKLRTILYSIWLFCALPEEKASCLYGILMFVVHIIEGTYYIKGGCDNLARELVNYIIKNSGKISYNSYVKSIFFENNIARGVILNNNEKIYGKSIILNCSPKFAFQNLIEEQFIPNLIKKRIEKLSPSLSCFGVYIAAKIDTNIESPFKNSQQIFYFEDIDNNKIYDSIINPDNNELIKHLLITEIPDIQKDNYRTYNIYSLMDINKFSDWKQVKGKIQNIIIEKFKKIIGNYIKDIEVIEAGTPNTFYRYTLNTNGAMYGFENSCDPYKGAKMDNKIGIPNIFLAGHWTKPGGSVYNSMCSGYKAYELTCEYLKKIYN